MRKILLLLLVAFIMTLSLSFQSFTQIEAQSNCRSLVAQAVTLLNQAKASFTGGDVATGKALISAAQALVKPCVNNPSNTCQTLDEANVLMGQIATTNTSATASALIDGVQALLKACVGAQSIPTRGPTRAPTIAPPPKDANGNFTFSATVVGIRFTYPGTWRGYALELTRNNPARIAVGNTSIGLLAAVLGASSSLKAGSGDFGVLISTLSFAQTTTARTAAAQIRASLRDGGYTVSAVQTTTSNGRTIAFMDVSKGTIFTRIAIISITDRNAAAAYIFSAKADITLAFNQVLSVLTTIRLS